MIRGHRHKTHARIGVHTEDAFDLLLHSSKVRFSEEEFVHLQLAANVLALSCFPNSIGSQCVMSVSLVQL